MEKIDLKKEFKHLYNTSATTISFIESAEKLLFNPLYPPVLGENGIWGTPPDPRQGRFLHLFFISLIKVPLMNFIMIDGSGAPNKAKEYQDAIEALYSVSYTIKFVVKKRKGNRLCCYASRKSMVD